jgi:hypothetical protein
MRQPTSDTTATPGRDPAEGRPDLDLPGADRAEPLTDRRPEDGRDPGATPRPDRNPPDAPDADLPQRLGEGVENGPRTGIATGEPDLVPDVEVPDETM